MTALKVRKPTGRVPWPLILIEGGEKSGKSWACAQFSTSPRIGQMYWIDLGEGAADEYGAIPGANYLVVEHDGTWAQIQGAVDAVKAEAARAADAGQPPVVLVIDSMTAEWDLLKDWASDKARQRHAVKVRKYGAKPLGPDDEPKISMDLWNEAGARHRKLMTTLMTFPGIVLLTARGKEVAALDDDGKPIEKKREYKVEGHKTLGFDVSCWIRLDRSKPGTVIGVRSVHVGIRPGYDDPIELARDWTVENIVFETLRCAPAEAHTRDLVALQPAEPDDERPASAPPAARPVSGPPAALSAAATGLLADLAQVTDETGLRRVWRSAGEAAGEGRISQAEAEHFQGQWRIRKEHLIPANPATEAMHKKIHVLCKEAGLDDRDTRLLFLSDVLGREIDTQRRLSVDDAKKVIDRLESAAAQNNPPAEQEGQAA
ncbi:AAA family ATPase [Micromonospora aurantiaca (nom. illeg.)]|uniref:AAA family ATPase n=1 Tax=Micromonospora aurantiaca (nom. illeg.) TaxID=47850 RepID=UPI0033E7E687